MRAFFKVIVLLGAFISGAIAFDCTPTGSPTIPTVQDFSISVKHDNAAPCILMRLGIYAKIGSNKYVDVGVGKINERWSRCPGEVEDLKSGLIALRYDCLDLDIMMDREHNDGPIEVISLSGLLHPGEDVVFNSTDNMIRAKQPNHAYRCDREQVLLANQQKNISLVLTSVHIEAFRDPDKRDYYQTEDRCDHDIEPGEKLAATGAVWTALIVAGALIVCIFGARLYWIRGKQVEEAPKGSNIFN